MIQSLQYIQTYCFTSLSVFVEGAVAVAEPSLAQDVVAPPVHLHRAPQPVLGVALGDAGVAQDTPEPESTQV